MVSGPTGSGKTHWIKKLLSNEMFTEKVESVLYCYGVYQPFFETMAKSISNITFMEGVPDFETIKNLNNGKFHVVVLDDLMEYIIKSLEIQNLFTKYCHHFNITAIFLTQNVFAKGLTSRTININTHILILFANKRDESQAIFLGKQICPSSTKVFTEAYEHATSKQYGYLVVDCDPQSPRELKLRTNIFPGDETLVYIKK